MKRTEEMLVFNANQINVVVNSSNKLQRKDQINFTCLAHPATINIPKCQFSTIKRTKELKNSPHT